MLRQALEASMQTHAQEQSRAPPSRDHHEEEEEDADIAAAIAASLRDVHVGTKPSSYPSLSAAAPEKAREKAPEKASMEQEPNSERLLATRPAPPPPLQHELSETEKKNLRLFCDLIAKVEQSGDNVVGNKTIQDLFAKLSALQPKLARSIDETSRRHSTNGNGRGWVIWVEYGLVMGWLWDVGGVGTWVVWVCVWVYGSYGYHVCI